MKKTILALSLALLLAGLRGPGPGSVRADSFVVTHSLDDANAHDWLPGDGMCVDSMGRCTLRAAIEEANAYPGTDTITFQTPMIIYVDASQGLLSLSDTVTIDASSVWDTVNNTPGVVINGVGGNISGLMVTADSCQIYGLYLTNFGFTGILVLSAANRIGGAGAGQRNVLSGNRIGVELLGSGAQNNVLHNNYIGLTPAGNTKNPNDDGLAMHSGAVDNIVGGNDSSHANYIAGNTTRGVVIGGDGTDNNWLGGNVIGLSADLSVDLGNGVEGIVIQAGAAHTVIGGASNSGNIISSSASQGITVADAGTGTRITDNIISRSGGDGIRIYSSSGCVISNNVINDNALVGVRVVGAAASGNLIWPNSIFANGDKGISLELGAHMGIAAPVIDSVDAWSASGTTCPSCRVALYSDSSDQGQVYHDILWADASGTWSYVGGPLWGPNLTATAIDNSDNTSQFSTPVAIPVRYQVFLPLAINNH